MDDSTKVWMNIPTIGREHVFANFRTNVVVSFGITNRANIFTKRWMEIGTDILSRAWMILSSTYFRAMNFWTNRNFGEGVAAKNI